MRRLHDWAAAQLNRTTGAGSGAAPSSSSLSASRENELRRLLHLLENEPDKGLRFAIPFSGESGRGQAPASGQLSERDADFRLSHLQSGGQVDVWDIPNDYRMELMRRYRDLAQREIRLGNYQRAAYIHAMLLNDLRTAATVLQSGKLYRQAAVLYQSHLRMPLAAAECLQDGGFWEEAVVIYLEQQQWLKAADLYESLGNLDEAAQMYHREIAGCETRRQFLTAASIADDRLNDGELAQRMCWRGWESNAQPEMCLRQLFSLLGARGLHRLAEDAVRRCSVNLPLNPGLELTALTVCGEQALTYPDGKVRDAMRRSVWQKAANVLRTSNPARRESALRTLTQLTPGDELMKRDAGRARLQMLARDRARGTKEPRTTGHGAAVRKSLRLNVQHRTTRLIEFDRKIESLFRIVGHYGGYWFARSRLPGKTLRIRRFELTEHGHQKLPEHLEEIPAELSMAGLYLRPCFSEPAAVWVQAAPNERRWNEQWHEQAERPQSMLRVLLPFPTEYILDMQPLFGGNICVFTYSAVDGQLRLHTLRPDGSPAQSVQIDLPNAMPLVAATSFVRLCIGSDRMLLVIGSHVVIVSQRDVHAYNKQAASVIEPERVIELPEVPNDVAVSPAGTPIRCLFALKSSIVVVWGATGDFTVVGKDLSAPTVVCTSDGVFIVVCQQARRIDCYQVRPDRTELIAEGSVRARLTESLRAYSGNTAGQFFVVSGLNLVH
ncbi:MAG: hypothetical protein KDA96_24780, partial [Planctomycetaceae bacterium]|nr:hypothetical protein [Planctomycetaceae bacterium]